MNEQNRPTDAQLHAYADGQLDVETHAQVSLFLAENPDDAACIADWQTQNDELRAAFGPFEQSRAGDIRLFAPRPGTTTSRPRRLAMAVAAVLIFATGALGGYAAPRLLVSPAERLSSTDLLPTEARNAFLVYASEVRHPVEVFADDETHLAAWLGKRLALTDLKVPDLRPLGFRLVGGRLLPVGGQPGAMFMYENQAGERLTVLIGRNSDNKETSFRFASAGGIETFYWLDQDIGCAVSGEISRDMLRQVADAVYRQIPV